MNILSTQATQAKMSELLERALHKMGSDKQIPIVLEIPCNQGIDDRLNFRHAILDIKASTTGWKAEVFGLSVIRYEYFSDDDETTGHIDMAPGTLLIKVMGTAQSIMNALVEVRQVTDIGGKPSQFSISRAFLASEILAW